MKKLFSLLSALLAINFLAVVGGVAWVVKTQHVDRDKLLAIKEIVFPKPTTAPATQPAETETATTPALRLEELVARAAGRTATEQVEFIQQAFDTKMAQLDRRERELRALEQQVELAKQAQAREQAALEADKLELQKRQQQATRLATDQGFQDALNRYIAMPAKSAKPIMANLDDDTLVNFLQAMEPKTAAKIIREFKTPEEISRIQTIMEKMRQAQASTGTEQGQ